MKTQIAVQKTHSVTDLRHLCKFPRGRSTGYDRSVHVFAAVACMTFVLIPPAMAVVAKGSTDRTYRMLDHLDNLDSTYVQYSRYHKVYRICAVQIQPRKYVLGDADSPVLIMKIIYKL